MASLESIILGHETVRWLSNVRSNLRSNAGAYKIAAAAGGANFTTIAAMMNADADQILNTINATEIVGAQNASKIAPFLSVFGLAISALDDAYLELRSATEALRAAAKTSKAEIDTASDAVLSSVTEYVLPKRA